VRIADYRSFRDRDSQELIRTIGVNHRLLVYPDPVYAMDVARFTKSAKSTNSKRVVGMNPIGFCDPRVWARHDASLYEAYLQKVTHFALWLVEQGYDLRIFTTESGLDRRVIEDVRIRLCASLAPELINHIFAGASETVERVLQQMSEFDFVITSKFHGIIFSHILGKPVISLSYHRKMDVAMESMGQCRFSTDIERFEVEWLIEAFRESVEQSDMTKSRFAATVKSNASLLSRQFDELFSEGNPQLV
jgi:polysaccharide pyruvyl transferase WcaK-like protein